MELVLKSILEVYIITGTITAIIFLLAITLLRANKISVDTDTFEQDYFMGILKSGNVIIALLITMVIGVIWPKVVISILNDEN